MRVLGVVPARGGSKGVRRKNIRPVAGRPLLAHTLACAAQARLLTRTVVSTENEEVASVARGLGAEVVRRPEALATDAAPTEPALLHAVDELARQGFHAEAVATLEPTSPLRTPALVDLCIERLARGGCDAVFTVVETRSVYGRLRGETFEPLLAGQARRRQDREPVYREASTVYVTRTDALRSTRSVLGTRPAALIISEEEAVDINTELDLALAENLLSARQSTAVP